LSEKAKLIRGDPPKIDFKKKGEPPKNDYLVGNYNNNKKIARVNFNKNKKMYYEVLQRINECLL
jgi:hypothetical protein